MGIKPVTHYEASSVTPTVGHISFKCTAVANLLYPETGKWLVEYTFYARCLYADHTPRRVIISESRTGYENFEVTPPADHRYYDKYGMYCSLNVTGSKYEEIQWSSDYYFSGRESVIAYNNNVTTPPIRVPYYWVRDPKYGAPYETGWKTDKRTTITILPFYANETDFWYGQYGNAFYLSLPNFTILSLDYTDPTLTLNVIDYDQTTATIEYTISNVPYDYRLQFSCGGRVIEDEEIEIDSKTNTITRQRTVTGLTPYQTQTARIEVFCENGKKYGAYESFVTPPFVAEQIVCPDDVYVNENEWFVLTPTLLPEYTTVKTMKFYNSYPDVYSLDRRYLKVDNQGTETDIRGIDAHGEDGTLATLTIEDFFKIAFKRVNVHVLRPATTITLLTKSKRIVPNAIYPLAYEILPVGSTDSEVTFASSDTSVAVVNSNGVVTGITEGTATITVTLKKVSADNNGGLLEPEYITDTATIEVSETPCFKTKYNYIYETSNVQFTYNFYDDMYNNISTLWSAMSGKSYEDDGETATIELNALQSRESTGLSTPIYDIRNLYNSIEDALDEMYRATIVAGLPDSMFYLETSAEAYGESFTWTNQDIHTAADKLYRWIDYMRCIFDFCEAYGLISPTGEPQQPTE